MTAARLLFVEDSSNDVELELAALRREGIEVSHHVVDGPEELREALDRERWDAVIADFRLPEFSGIDALRMVRARDPDVPFVLVSGTVGEELAVEAMRAGASDYVLKDNLTRLPAAIARELRELEGRREKRRMEAEQRFLAEARRFLADAGAVLGRSLDVRSTLREAARLAVPALADHAFALAVEGERVRAVAHATPDVAARPLVEELPPEFDPADASDAVQALLAGRPVVREQVADADLEAVSRDPGHLAALRALGLRSAVAVPLRGRTRVVGALVFAFAGSGRRYGEREVALALDFAARVGLAAENGLLFEEAQEGVRVRDEFLAMLGHELRNPLAPILTAIQLMKLRGESAGQKEFAVIERQTRHLIRLVDDLLDIARITRGKVTLNPSPTEIANVVDRAVEMTDSLVAKMRHRLHVEVPREGLRVFADETRLAQVVANLLTNAAKYTPEGGEIRVSASRQGPDVVLSVADNGTGIAPELLPHLFDAFVQGPRSIDRREGGLGLGLALVRNLVGLHGGTVNARSEGPGRGSEFVVRLPALEEGATGPVLAGA